MREGQRGYCQAALSCAAEIRRARGPPSKRTKSRCRRQDPPSSSPESSSATGKIRRTPDRRARAPPPRSAELHSGGKQGGGGRVGSAPGRRGRRPRVRQRGAGSGEGENLFVVEEQNNRGFQRQDIYVNESRQVFDVVEIVRSESNGVFFL